MAADGVIVTYIFTGEEEREYGHLIIPENATHLLCHESVTSIPAGAFQRHPNIIEVYCHAGVKKIEVCAFAGCWRLRRVIIPGVEVVEGEAFMDCEAVTDIECPKLEKIGKWTFNCCTSLSSINLPSAKVVEAEAFIGCYSIVDAKFGTNLATLREKALWDCRSLDRITMPLKNSLIDDDALFIGCENLKRVDLVEGAIHETVAALHLEQWRNDMNVEIDSINRILQYVPAGGRPHPVYGVCQEIVEDGVKAIVIRGWIAGVLRKIIRYKVEHRQLLSEAANILQHFLPNDNIVMNNVVPFLDLSPHEFEGEDHT